MIVLRLVSGVRSHFVTRMPEWGLALILAGESVQFLRSGETFRTAPGFSILAGLISEENWGYIAALVASLWLIALFLNGTLVWFRRISPWSRSLCACSAASYWGFEAATMNFANPLGVAVVTYAGLSFIAFGLSINTAREVGAADKEARKCSRRSHRKVT